MRKVAIACTCWLFCLQRDNSGVPKEVDLAEDRRTEILIYLKIAIYCNYLKKKKPASSTCCTETRLPLTAVTTLVLPVDALHFSSGSS